MHTAVSTAVIDEQGQQEPEAQVREMEQKPQNTAIIGILVAILTFLLVQTGGIAYWAGQQSGKQDATATQLNEMKQKMEIISAQYQVVTNKLAALEAATNRGK